jgi:hypothetical protein
MTVDEQHFDGNGVRGTSARSPGRGMTSVLRTCQSCWDRRAIGEHRPSRGAGVVLRCPSCEDVAMVIGMQDTRRVVDRRGTYGIQR